MPTSHTRASRIATAAMALLLVVQATGLVLRPHRSYLEVLLLTFVVSLGLTAAKLHRDNCVESRCGAAILAVLGLGATVLAITAGPPGQPADGFGVLAVLTLAASLAVVGALVLDGTRRFTDPDRSGSAYAS